MPFDTQEYIDFLETIRVTYGFDFSDYSVASLKRRFEHFMSSRQFRDLQELREALLSDERIFAQFIQAISVTVTEMFRDPAFYSGLRENVFKRLATYPIIRVWVAGCATGQEAYSIAIMLQEAKLLERSVIYATDINQHSLQVAKEGIYSLESMKNYAENYSKSGGKRLLSDYYMEKFNMILLNKNLRKKIVFADHNLVTDKSFNEFHLILCRNVLIYFNQNLQSKVIELFYGSLRTFGFLCLGNKESLHFTPRQTNFKEVVTRDRIYMKMK